MHTNKTDFPLQDNHSAHNQFWPGCTWLHILLYTPCPSSCLEAQLPCKYSRMHPLTCAPTANAQTARALQCTEVVGWLLVPIWKFVNQVIINKWLWYADSILQYVCSPRCPPIRWKNDWFVIARWWLTALLSLLTWLLIGYNLHWLILLQVSLNPTINKVSHFPIYHSLSLYSNKALNETSNWGLPG